MAPSHTTRSASTRQNAEWNHAILHQCPHCNRKFQKTSFKQHEASCRKRKEDERERVAFERQYEEKQRAAHHRAARASVLKSQPRVLEAHRTDTGYFFVDEPVEVTMGQDYNETSDMLQASDVSMPTATSSNVAKLPEFKIQFHPRSNRPPIYQSYEEFRVHSEKSPSPVDKTPWSPFRTLGDFEFAEIALASLLNQQQVNALLDLFARVTQGAIQVTLKNDAELRKVCDAAAMELTPFSRVEVKVPYKKEECTFEAHIRPLWEWALDILENPFLGLHFTWDAQRLYRHDGVEYERFYDEPWTRDYWWDIQSSLPDIKNTVPFGLILYADKSNLSSFGTAKSYPVVVHCANLPVEIRNSNVVGGGTVVSWLPIVPEDAKEEGKLGYTTLKHVVWHESFKKLLLEIEQYSKTGVASFPHWQNLAHFNQVIHVTFSDGNKLADISKQIFYAGINVLKKSITPEGYQLLQVIRSYLQLDSLVSLDVQTEHTVNMINDEILTFDQTLKDYTKCVVKSNIDGLRTDWNFLKVHLWKHIVRDIHLKGATHNYSTRPNKSMHKPIRDTYEHRSNGRDVPAQVLQVDHQVLATKLLRLHVDHLKKSVSGESDPEVDAVSEHTSVDHIKLGAHVVMTQTLKDLEENGQPDMAFHRFRQRFCEFLNDALPAYGYQVKSWISLPLTSRLKHVKTVPQAASIFIPLCSIIQGAVLAPDTEHDDEFFVVEQLDSDMFLRTQAM
ncbi:hypothetical protein M404DRAFT_35449 [Pisolithus tinctorius Marx 270]|uniref:C2HC/C3H-type domain-containing protein n=1 Tax=Pisolithus tinctorius Marx 270 TaxID=870435 RepID=A0A0C3IAD2_PISTI|nr:hypothetical protein M404DRAFT_35449 [Pisolithus tinctorius Marx 270]